VAEILGKVLERKVSYKDVPFRTFAKAAMAQGYPISDIAHMRYYAEELREGAFAIGAPTEHVREVTGSEPECFESIARRYVRNPEFVHLSLRIGTRLNAFLFLLKMMATRPVDFDAWEGQQGYPIIKNSMLSQDSSEWIATAERGELNLLTAG
jgi:hypothetical protein